LSFADRRVDLRKRLGHDEEDDEGPIAEVLLEQHEDGDRNAVPWPGKKLTPRARRNVRTVYERVVLMWGLWQSTPDPPPGILMTPGWLAEKDGITEGSARHALKALRDVYGIIRRTEPFRLANGTITWLIAPVPDEQRGEVLVERRATVVRQPGEPEVEVVDDPLVAAAELAGDVRGDAGAIRETARAHTQNDTPPNVHFSSRTDEWSTPPDLFAEIDAEFGPLGLDVCATPENAKCPRYFTREEDGLAQTGPGASG
jgi:hypothetical protein